MSKPSPLVSIKIASYNHARFIGRTVQSLLEQSYSNFEIIIVDDCSSDNSVEVVRGFNDPRITLLVNDSNIGAAASSKKAQAYCRGKYFCSLDSDDYFHADKLAEQVAYLEGCPEVDLVATFIQEVDDQDNLITHSSVSDWFNRNLDLNRPENWLWGNHVCHSSVMMRRNVHARFWDYDSGLPYTNDWHNWIRFLANGVKFGVLPEKLTYYRCHSDNVSHKNPIRSYWEYAYISAVVLHPYLETINRRDMVRDNMERFLSDSRYPAASIVEKNRFLRLLLNVDLPEYGFEPVWKGRFVEDARDRSGVHYEFLLIEGLRQRLTDSSLRIESMRQELRRVENRAFRTARLGDVLFQERFSFNKVIKASYIAISCIVPDILQWPFRSVTAGLWRLFRRFQNPGGTAPYRVHVPPAAREQKRVVHVIASFAMGGSSQLIVDIIEALGHVYRQEILTSSTPAPPAYQGVSVHEYRSQYEIQAFLKEFRPDLIHVHYWGGEDWAWYDKVFRAIEQSPCKVIENVRVPVPPYESKNVCRYVYMSDYALRNFGRLGVGDVIYPGVNIDQFSQEHSGNVPDNCVGTFGWLEAGKIDPRSVDVFVRVARRCPDVKILVIGGGYFLKQYKEAVLAQAVENAFWFVEQPFIAELAKLYAKMSILVVPLWKAGSGQSSVLAMSMGIPVTGYNVGEFAEIVDNDDLLATPWDSEMLANIIVDLMDDRDRRRVTGAGNRHRAESLFSIENAVQRYESLYRDVIDRDE